MTVMTSHTTTPNTLTKQICYQNQGGFGPQFRVAKRPHWSTAKTSTSCGESTRNQGLEQTSTKQSTEVIANPISAPGNSHGVEPAALTVPTARFQQNNQPGHVTGWAADEPRTQQLQATYLQL